MIEVTREGVVMAGRLTLIEYLEGALVSAQRLRGKRIYSDTLRYWHDLLVTAGEAQQSERVSPQVDRLIHQLETELKRHPEP
jgi:hypothetical protein